MQIRHTDFICLFDKYYDPLDFPVHRENSDFVLTTHPALITAYEWSLMLKCGIYIHRQQPEVRHRRTDLHY